MYILRADRKSRGTRRVWSGIHEGAVNTMQDPYGREITYLRLSVTERCNLRCRYCMPGDGIAKKSREIMLTEDEMVRAVEAAASLGIRKLRLTGGEPLVKKNILSICRRCGVVDGIREICITTNGILLPELAKPLREAGLTRINLSLDTLDRDKYAFITRRGRLEDALRGLDAALTAGFEKVKINSVLIGGFNDSEILALADLTRQYPVDVRFIELMPIGGLGFGPEAYLPCTAVLERLPELKALPEDGGVAKRYCLPGGLGSIGLITPVSTHFCAQCNRIRLTADGYVKPCLHAAAEFPIKGLSQEEMAQQMERAILAKPPCHAPLTYGHQSHAERNMNQIGG